MAKYRCKIIKMVLKVCSEIPLNKNRQHIAASQLVYTEFQFLGLYVIQSFIKGFFQKGFKTSIVCWMPLDHSLRMVYVF